jgi:lipid A ethanolaminephosphotransferase
METRQPVEPSFFRRIAAFIRHPEMSRVQLNLLVSVFLVLFYNYAFWAEIGEIATRSIQDRLFLGSIFLLLVAFFNLCLSCLSFKFFSKPCLVVTLLIATFAAYFMQTYGIMIDRAMVKNILTTDMGDISELLNVKMLYCFVLLGVIPSVFVLRTKIRYNGLVRELFMVSGSVLMSLVLMVVILVFFYKDYISLGNNYNYVRHLVNPVSSLYAVVSCAKRTVAGGRTVVGPIGEDARLEKGWQERGRKNLVILVVGEAARAGNFSLNGYTKKTNPFLEKEDILSFTSMYSCGTVSSVSLPCMFSHFDREAFSEFKAQRHEGLLDVVSRAGVEVLWRENNSGCKGVCDRVKTENMSERCPSGECRDMILLEGMQQRIDQIEGDALIVMHQKGSYGPGYYRRSPPEFKAFLPECTTNQLQQCRADELVNAYDNTILYTDYFLAQVIDLLKQNSGRFNTAMLYLSDYGESLGEKNIYLHGLPYVIAPDEQKHVPFLLWFGGAFLEENGIDRACLQRKVNDAVSHDNLFHSVLGLLGIKTVMVEKELDIFAGCRRAWMPK